MKDVMLYGNLIYDKVFDGAKKYETAGGIANVWKHLRSYKDISVDLSPISLGEAIILVDRSQNQRTSKSLMTQTSIVPEIIPARWNHISYLDHLPKPEFVYQLKGIVSADLCGNGTIDPNILKYVQVMFAGDGDDIDMSSIFDANIPYIVYHSAHKITIFSTGKNAKTIKVGKIINGVNVLGVGDMFAAEVIRNMKDTELSLANLYNAVSTAQQTISQILETSR